MGIISVPIAQKRAFLHRSAELAETVGLGAQTGP